MEDKALTVATPCGNRGKDNRLVTNCNLCKVWGFQGGEYEEYRLLGYKNAVRTSQETHYLSATESSRLKLCKI
jgi:hypothetical protein